MSRTGRVERSTKESSVLVTVDLDGSGITDIDTGVPFYDHMLAQLGKHGLFDLRLEPFRFDRFDLCGELGRDERRHEPQLLASTRRQHDDVNHEIKCTPYR